VVDQLIADQRPASRWTPYRSVLASRVRAQRSYRTSFVIDTVSAFVVGLVELAETWVIFHNVHVLGGLDFAAILLVFGLANIGFSTAEVLVGHVDTLPAMLRAGTLDIYYLRPQPLLAQVITADVQLRRIARVAVGVVCAVIALCINDIHWSPATVGMLALSLIFGTAIYCSLFVTAGGLQFFLINGPEATNAFVYGGQNASTQPAAVWPGPLKVVFGFLFPVAFCAYLPTLVILGLPGPPMLPSWLAWCLPVAALWAAGIAALTWRWGVRHYQGGGG
jgi:ABC-2 type transport system permease protein